MQRFDATLERDFFLGVLKEGNVDETSHIEEIQRDPRTDQLRKKLLQLCREALAHPLYKGIIEMLKLILENEGDETKEWQVLFEGEPVFVSVVHEGKEFRDEYYTIMVRFKDGEGVLFCVDMPFASIQGDIHPYQLTGNTYSEDHSLLLKNPETTLDQLLRLTIQTKLRSEAN